MFDISWGELLLIGVVALIVIGPKELPGVLRAVGQWMTKLRSMANEFQGQFQEAIREAEMADLKKEVDDLTAKATSYTNFDPLSEVQKEIESTIADKPAAPAAETAATTAAAASHSEAALAHTPADVTAPVESAMRAAAELNAASAEVASQAPPSPVEQGAAPPSAAAADTPPASAAVANAPAAPQGEDDWPVPATFREPFDAKRNAGG
jgi:sec-independent protein translocase protein TatB